METEIWPNLLAAARCARRADGARERAPERAQPAPRPALRGLDATGRAERRAGARAERGRRGAAQRGRRAQRRRQRQPQVRHGADSGPGRCAARPGARRSGRPVVLAAVTREGEEAALVAAWTQRPSPRPLLLVVPRHPQRFDEVAGLLQDAGLRFARRSEWRDGQGPDARELDAVARRLDGRDGALLRRGRRRAARRQLRAARAGRT